MDVVIRDRANRPLYTATLDKSCASDSSGAQLGKAVVQAWKEGVSLHNANLDKMVLFGQTVGALDLTQASLCGVNLTGCRISAWDLTNAILGRAIWEKVDATDVCFNFATIHRTKMGGATLTDAKFIGAFINGSDFSSVLGRGTRFQGACIQDSTFREAFLTEANFNDCTIANVDFGGVDLTNTRFNVASLERTQMRNAIFANTKFHQFTDALLVKFLTDGVYLANIKEAFLRYDFSFLQGIPASMQTSDIRPIWVNCGALFTQEDTEENNPMLRIIHRVLDRAIQIKDRIRTELMPIDKVQSIPEKKEDPSTTDAVVLVTDSGAIREIVTLPEHARTLPKERRLALAAMEYVIAGGELSNVVLDGADFSTMTLSKMNFSGAHMRANFSNAKLQGCHFRDVIGFEMNFANAEVKQCWFTGAKMPRSNFKKAVFDHVDFRHTELFKAEVDNATITDSDLTGSNWQGSTFHGTELRRCDMTDVDVQNCMLIRTSMPETDIGKVKLLGSIFVPVPAREVKLV